mgnify:CR=1 FL=1
MYRIRYDVRVAEDIKRIDGSVKKEIRAAIESKLGTRPEIFGKPLRQSLTGLRVLRVSNYRVIFQLKKNGILVLLIGNRASIYREAQERFE